MSATSSRSSACHPGRRPPPTPTSTTSCTRGAYAESPTSGGRRNARIRRCAAPASIPYGRYRRPKGTEMSTDAIAHEVTTAGPRAQLLAGTSITERRIDAAGMSTAVTRSRLGTRRGRCCTGRASSLPGGPRSSRHLPRRTTSSSRTFLVTASPNAVTTSARVGGRLARRRHRRDLRASRRCSSGGCSAVRSPCALPSTTAIGSIGSCSSTRSACRPFEPAPPFGEALHRYLRRADSRDPRATDAVLRARRRRPARPSR